MDHQSELPNDLTPVPGIAPYAGWALLSFQYRNEDGFTLPAYVAANETLSWYKLLYLSGHDFHPTQARWNWLVDRDFPRGKPGRGGAISLIDDAHIDNGLAALRASVA